MKSHIKKIAFTGILIFLLLQFYQPARNSDYGQVSSISIGKVHHIPKKVEVILQTSCYDCHSNNTRYPWYSNLQPIRSFMENHIKKGKNNLNFSRWGAYSKRKQGTKLNRIISQIKSDEMPLSSYTLIHRDAVLSAAQKKEIIDWAEKLNDSI
ncbi:heme-binding domain-containing protein [Flavobacterium sp. N502540]|uniref:heme-binding domain-containing protein n=1 Tax=Flavobacterium sp. N502540 TaxID=2986838 RepID=UPI0022253FA8|nr:heme-binding domain-containing protein [Flavobacterium sp. N502540]